MIRLLLLLTTLIFINCDCKDTGLVGDSMRIRSLCRPIIVVAIDKKTSSVLLRDTTNMYQNFSYNIGRGIADNYKIGDTLK